MSYAGPDSRSVIVAPTVNNAASPYTALMSARKIPVDPSGGAVTINLPDATTVRNAVFTVFEVGGSTTTITIQDTAGNNLDGSATATITAAYGQKTFISDGSEWWSI